MSTSVCRLFTSAYADLAFRAAGWPKSLVQGSARSISGTIRLSIGQPNDQIRKQ